LTNLSAGSYTVTVSDQNNCSVIEIIDVKDNTSTSQLTVSNFSLIDADKNKIINEFNPLKNHDTLNLAKLPSRNLNIQANISSNEVGSVRFALNGNSNYSTDNAAPFYLAGGLPWTPTVGTYTLTATPINKSGIAGATSSVVLHVIDQADQPNLQDIKPILECVTDNGDGTLTATFGYLNNNAEEIIIAEGPSNNLNPLPLEANIPEKFLPGRQHNVFSVKFSSKANLIWTLENLGGSTRTATANAGSEKCTSDGELSTQVKPRKIFSPNEDGIDDLWKIENIELYPEYEVVIFNRSGKKVFEAKPYTNNWDGRFAGTPLLSEAYYYVIKSANQGNIKSGSVTLIR
jgi:gliding motility-associated-like protein